MAEQENETVALDGTILDTQLYDHLYTGINTYTELPLMLELAAYEVATSEFDSLKIHALTYHISGLVGIVAGVKKALKHLEDEAKILGVDLSEEMDMSDYRRYQFMKKALEKFL